MHIVELRAENVKRLRAVQIKPDADANLIVIGGENAAGKSSVLDSIAFALGGKSLICDEPLRKGGKKGSVFVDLGDYRVTRTFTDKGGGSLKVEDKTGKAQGSPQRLLDGVAGPLSFDPLAFSRMKPPEQLETLKALVGLDFAELEKKRKALYDERTAVSRQSSQLRGNLSMMPQHINVPPEEVSIAALTEELERANAASNAIGALERQKEEALTAVGAARASMVDAEDRIKELQAEIAGHRANQEIYKSDIAKGLQLSDELQGRIEIETKNVPDRDELRARISGAEELNRKVREQRAFIARDTEAEQVDDLARSLTRQIEDLDEEKEKAILAAEYPVEGLSVGDNGVLFGSIPFSQASSAEQLRVSVAMGLAMNPDLKILLIRDGSLLDVSNLQMIAGMAAEAKAQVWLERVGEDEATSVIIEDGMVRPYRAEVEEEEPSGDTSGASRQDPEAD